MTIAPTFQEIIPYFLLIEQFNSPTHSLSHHIWNETHFVFPLILIASIYIYIGEGGSTYNLTMEIPEKKVHWELMKFPYTAITPICNSNLYYISQRV